MNGDWGSRKLSDKMRAKWIEPQRLLFNKKNALKSGMIVGPATCDFSKLPARLPSVLIGWARRKQLGKNDVMNAE